MTKLFVLAAAASLMLSGSASAQDKAQKSMTNCPSGAATTDRARQNGQAVEKSAILPSTGGEAGSSAAGTVQRDGRSVEVSSDCPQELNTKAGKPKS